MKRPHKYILKGKRVYPVDDILKWANWIEKEDRRVDLTKVGKYKVSTVFLGIDHSFGTGEPLLFETMIFGKGEFDEYQERYSTWGEAEKGHKKIVEMVKNSIRGLKNEEKRKKE